MSTCRVRWNLLKLEHLASEDEREVALKRRVHYQGVAATIEGRGNGPISAFVDGMQQRGWKNFILDQYRQHSIGSGSKTQAAAYIQIHDEAGRTFFGCGIDVNSELAAIRALVSAYNRSQQV
jgi:2-isopropylmalate synthase